MRPGCHGLVDGGDASFAQRAVCHADRLDAGHGSIWSGDRRAAAIALRSAVRGDGAVRSDTGGFAPCPRHEPCALGPVRFADFRGARTSGRGADGSGPGPGALSGRRRAICGDAGSDLHPATKLDDGADRAGDAGRSVCAWRGRSAAARWDPYATPGNTPSALMQQDPCFQSSPAISMAAMQRFVQQINLNYDWFAGNPTATDRELGINDVDLNVTFAFPLFNIQTPILVSPGFAVHYWSGPVSVHPTPAAPFPVDLPPQTYDAYLDFGWNPQISDVFGAELNFRTGVYSDFSRVTSDSIRVMGKGMAVLKLSPRMTLKAGVWYLDRVQVKILPAGGLVWTPNADVDFDILFPNPKVAKRLTTWGCTEWWLYAAGDYGGGTWTSNATTDFYRRCPHGTYTRFDYNDIRIAVGLEFKTPRQLAGHFEVGLSCDRELVYADDMPRYYYPNNTVYIGAGLAY